MTQDEIDIFSEEEEDDHSIIPYKVLLPWDIQQITSKLCHSFRSTYTIIIQLYEKEHITKKDQTGITSYGAISHRKNEKDVLVTIELPPFRNYRASDIINTIQKNRGWKSRCRKAIITANNLGLNWTIRKSLLLDSFFDFVKEYKDLVTF